MVASGQHVHELLDTPGAGIRSLCAGDPVHDGVSVGACELLEYRPCMRLVIQGFGEVLGNFNRGLPGISSCPSPITLCLPHLVIPWRLHSTSGGQLLDDGDVPSRPLASGFSGREASAEGRRVTTTELPVNPPETDCLLERLVVRKRRRVGGTPLGQHEPHAIGVGVVSAQPGSPFPNTGDDQLRGFHRSTLSLRVGTTAGGVRSDEPVHGQSRLRSRTGSSICGAPMEGGFSAEGSRPTLEVPPTASSMPVTVPAGPGGSPNDQR